MDTAQSHEISKEHLKARDLHKAAVEPTGKSEAGRVWLQINEVDRKKLCSRCAMPTMLLKMVDHFLILQNCVCLMKVKA